MKIYCINMENERVRREGMLRECARHNLDVEFITCVDGQALTPDEVKELVYRPLETFLSRGEIGCVLSHVKAYEKLLSDNEPMALVLEDDVVFTSDPHPFIEAAARLNPEEPDVLVITDNKSFLPNKGRMLGNLEVFPIVRALNAHAYFITRAAARNLAAFLRPVRTVLDYWKYFVRCGVINVWVNREVFAVQDRNTFPSTITMERKVSRSSPGKGRFLKHVNAMMPFSRKVRYILWKMFVKPFSKIEHGEAGKKPVTKTLSL